MRVAKIEVVFAMALIALNCIDTLSLNRAELLKNSNQYHIRLVSL